MGSVIQIAPALLTILVCSHLQPVVGDSLNSTKDLQSSGTENRPLLDEHQGVQSFQFGYEVHHEEQRQPEGQNYDPGTYQEDQGIWKKKSIRNKNRRRNKSSKYYAADKFYPSVAEQDQNATEGAHQDFLRDIRNHTTGQQTYSEYYPVSEDQVQENIKSESQKSVTHYQYVENPQESLRHQQQQYNFQSQESTQQYDSQSQENAQQYNTQSQENTQQYNSQSQEISQEQQYSSQSQSSQPEKVVDCSRHALYEVPAPQMSRDFYGHHPPQHEHHHPQQNNPDNYYSHPAHPQHQQHQEMAYENQGPGQGHILQNVQVVNIDPAQFHQGGANYQNGPTIILYDDNGGQVAPSIRNEAYQNARQEYMAKLGVHPDGIVEYEHRMRHPHQIDIVAENTLSPPRDHYNGGDRYQGEGGQHIVLQIEDTKQGNQDMFIEIPVTSQEQFAMVQPQQQGESAKHAPSQEIVIEIDPQRPESAQGVFYEVEPKGKRVNVRHAQKASPAAENDLQKVYIVDSSKPNGGGSHEEGKSEMPVQQVIVVDGQEQSRNQEAYVQIVPADQSSEVHQNRDEPPSGKEHEANYQSADAPKVIYSEEDSHFYQNKPEENNRDSYQQHPRVPFYQVNANAETRRPVEQPQDNTEHHKLPLFIQIEDYKPNVPYEQRVPNQNGGNQQQHFDQRPNFHYHQQQGEAAQESIPRDIPRENYVRVIEPMIPGPHGVVIKTELGPNSGPGEYRNNEHFTPPPQNFFMNQHPENNVENMNNFRPMPPRPEQINMPHIPQPNGFGHLEQLPLSNIYIKEEGKEGPNINNNNNNKNNNNNFGPGPVLPYNPQLQQEMMIKPEDMKEILFQLNEGASRHPKEQASYDRGMMAAFNNNHRPTPFPFGDVGSPSLRHPQEIRDRPSPPPPHQNRPQIQELPVKIIEVQVNDEKPRRPPPPPPVRSPPPMSSMFPEYFDFLNIKTRNKPNYNRNPQRPRRPQRRPNHQRDPKTASGSFHKDAFAGFPKDFQFDSMFGSTMMKDFGFGMGSQLPHRRPMPGPPKHMKSLRKSHPRDQKKFRFPPRGPKSKDPYFLSEHGIESVSGFPLNRQRPRPPKNFDHSLPKVFMRLHDLPKKRRNHNKPKRGYASSSRPIRSRGPRRPRPYSPEDPIKKIIREVESMPYLGPSHSGLDSITIEHHYEPLSMLPSGTFGWDDIPFLPTPLLKK